MEKIFDHLKYLIIAAFIFMVIFFYFTVFTPLKNRLETSLENEFKQTLAISESNVEHYFQQQMENVNSLASRTMIRQKLYEYKSKIVDLAAVQAYTQPKYVDGVEALDNILGAYRISGQDIIASWGRTGTIKLKNYYDIQSEQTKIKFFPEQKKSVVITPINKQGLILGYDIASFDVSNILNEINKANIDYSIVESAPAVDMLREDETKIRSFRQILGTDYFLKAETQKENLYQTLNLFSMMLVIAIIVSLVIIFLLFKFVIDKTSKEVITELEEKNQEINQALQYNQKYKKLFDNINSGVAVYEAVNNGEDFKFVDINKVGQNIDNLDQDEIIGKRIEEVFPGVKEFGLFSVLQRVYETGEAEKFPLKKYQDDRITAYRENYVYKLSSGEVVAVYNDLTEQKKQEKELRETKNRLEMAIEGANLGLWDWNSQTGKLEINDKWLEMIGYKDENSVQTYEDWKSKIHEEDEARVLRKLEQHINGVDSYYESEYRLKTKSGDWKWIKAIGKVMERDEDDNPLRVVGIHQDIDDRKKAEEKIKYLSFHDKLTGLYNRRYFESEAERLNSSRRLPITIVIGDVDGLKYINDNYGHQQGDEYIKKAANIFEAVTREEDIVARVGGDEFAVLLPETDAEAAAKFCDRFYDKLEEYNASHQSLIFLEISLGYATKKKPEQNLNKIYDQADQAMYENKESQR